MPLIRHLTMLPGGAPHTIPPGALQVAPRRRPAGVRPQPPLVANLRPSAPAHHPVMSPPPLYDVDAEEDDHPIVLPPLTPAEWRVMEDALRERARAMVERPGLAEAVDLLAKVRPHTLVRRAAPSDPVQLVLDTTPTCASGLAMDGLA